MKKLYILKIGGSVATYKSKRNMTIRRKLLNQVAKNIKKFNENNRNIKLIIVHGAGGGGHYLAKKYNLQENNLNEHGLRGSLLCSSVIQNLNNTISKIFLKNNLNVKSINTSSIIIQNNKKIKEVNKKIIENFLKNKYIPILYGDMVYDEKLGMSICSGDKIIDYLSTNLNADKIFFATDVDGIFTDDPHINKKAKLIKNISLKKIFSNKKINISKSHNIDVTEGLLGKIKSLKKIFINSNLSEVIIFNGLKSKNYLNVLLNNKIISTKIKK